MQRSRSPVPFLVVAGVLAAAGSAGTACSSDETVNPVAQGGSGGGATSGGGVAGSSGVSSGNTGGADRGEGGSGGVDAGSGAGEGGEGGAAGNGGMAGSGGGASGGAGGTDGSGGGATGGAGGEPGGGGAGGEPGGGGAGGGAQPTLDCSPPRGAEGALKLTTLVTGLVHPLLAKGAPGDLSRLFILTQQGQILVYRDGALQPEPFLDIRALVEYRTAGELGLLGFAFHPDYQSNGRFFVHFSNKTTLATRIVEFKRGASPDVADPTPVANLLEQEQPERNHNGGSIEFSPIDGFLYIGLGDGGGSGDRDGNGQALSTLLGKILRIDVATQPYGIPHGNMTGEGVRPEIWDYGLRNPYRFSFDACTGDLYIGDVGQSLWEEINIEPAGQGNKNYGWRLMEGAHCFTPATNCDPGGLTTLPTVEYGQLDPVLENCSVIGGYVYRGSAIPWLRGAYFYGDYCSGRVWTLAYQPEATPMPIDRTDDLGTLRYRISGFGQDSAGEVYMTDLDGSVFRVDPE